jgi:hypothetical protein
VLCAKQSHNSTDCYNYETAVLIFLWNQSTASADGHIL